jgi:ribonuclease H2 subunit A
VHPCAVAHFPLPYLLSQDMLRASPISLNALSYDAVCRILKRIAEDRPEPPQVTDIFIDTVGDPEYYKSRLVANLGGDFGRFTIEKKADAKFKVVGAASIVAKVHRDTVLKEWKWAEPTVQLDKNFGSGYPGDEACVKWCAATWFRPILYSTFTHIRLLLMSCY